MHVEVEDTNESKGDEWCDPADDEHDPKADYGSEQRQPHWVVFEGWTPTCVWMNM